MQSQEKAHFWDKKILAWERSRYAGDTTGQAYLEKLVKRGGGSIQNRLYLAAEFLRPHLNGKTLLDVGCGSGLLFHCLTGVGAASFVGVDIAPAAIEEAKRRAEDALTEPATYLAGSVLDLALPHYDIVSALGLLDWLSDDEMDRFFGLIRGKQFLLSISERRRSFSQLLHRLYVYIAYGWKYPEYTPRYDDANSIVARLEFHGFNGVKILRHKQMSFGVLLHNFPSNLH